MIQVYQLLHVGSEHDFERVVRHRPEWRVVHACKEPYHRQALGYSGRGAPKTHPEYLIARRGHRLILNLVDAPDPAYIPKEIIDSALEFIHQSLIDGANVLVHCNEGGSRAPSIALLYLVSRTELFAKLDQAAVLMEYRTLYPPFNPTPGMSGFIQENLAAYQQRNQT